MKKKIILGGPGLSAAIIAMAISCHKNTSTSSASGSIGGAMGDLALLSLSKAAGQSGFPNIVSAACSSGSISMITNALFSNPGGICPSGYGSGTTYSGYLTFDFSNCVSAGYAYNNSLTFTVSSSSPIVHCDNNNTPSDTEVSGGFNLYSTSFTITGNGINIPCSNVGGSQFEMNANATINYLSYETSLIGHISGPSCGASFSNVLFTGN